MARRMASPSTSSADQVTRWARRTRLASSRVSASSRWGSLAGPEADDMPLGLHYRLVVSTDWSGSTQPSVVSRTLVDTGSGSFGCAVGVIWPAGSSSYRRERIAADEE